VLVQADRNALVIMAAYIDLNAIRAGVADDPKDYRWCGYAEAVAGSPEARRGIGHILGRNQGRCVRWDAAQRRYRVHLFLTGKQGTPDARDPKVRRGFHKQKVEEVKAKGGELSMEELMLCRVRYLTDGMIFGSKAFVNEVFVNHREHFSAKRKDGARRMRWVDWGDLYTARDLQADVIGV
jgi:hypothetical protein